MPDNLYLLCRTLDLRRTIRVGELVIRKQTSMSHLRGDPLTTDVEPLRRNITNKLCSLSSSQARLPARGRFLLSPQQSEGQFHCSYNTRSRVNTKNTFERLGQAVYVETISAWNRPGPDPRKLPWPKTESERAIQNHEDTSWPYLWRMRR